MPDQSKLDERENRIYEMLVRLWVSFLIDTDMLGVDAKMNKFGMEFKHYLNPPPPGVHDYRPDKKIFMDIVQLEDFFWKRLMEFNDEEQRKLIGRIEETIVLQVISDTFEKYRPVEQNAAPKKMDMPEESSMDIDLQPPPALMLPENGSSDSLLTVMTRKYNARHQVSCSTVFDIQVFNILEIYDFLSWKDVISASSTCSWMRAILFENLDYIARRHLSTHVEMLFEASERKHGYALREMIPEAYYGCETYIFAMYTALPTGYTELRQIPADKKALPKIKRRKVVPKCKVTTFPEQEITLHGHAVFLLLCTELYQHRNVPNSIVNGQFYMGLRDGPWTSTFLNGGCVGDVYKSTPNRLCDVTYSMGYRSGIVSTLPHCLLRHDKEFNPIRTQKHLLHGCHEYCREPMRTVSKQEQKAKRKFRQWMNAERPERWLLEDRLHEPILDLHYKPFWHSVVFIDTHRLYTIGAWYHALERQLHGPCMSFCIKLEDSVRPRAALLPIRIDFYNYGKRHGLSFDFTPRMPDWNNIKYPYFAVENVADPNGEKPLSYGTSIIDFIECVLADSSEIVGLLYYSDNLLTSFEATYDKDKGELLVDGANFALRNLILTAYKDPVHWTSLLPKDDFPPIMHVDVASHAFPFSR